MLQERPRLPDFGMPANRLPRMGWIADITQANAPVENIGLSIEFWGVDKNLTSRNWHAPEERTYKFEVAKKSWAKICELALQVHGASADELLQHT